MPGIPLAGSSTRTRRSTGHCWWQCLIPDVDGSSRLIVVESGRYPDGSRVQLSSATDADHVADHAVCEAVIRNGVVEVLRISVAYAPKAPPVWFVEVREPGAQPPAVNLVAFTAAGQPTGALLDEAAAANVAVTSADQLGAIRWYSNTGEIDQIYVAPEWRRHHIATALLSAAGTLSVARGWPRMWADGQRTALGEKLRNARAWASRAADLTHLAPPMTPGEDSSDSPE